MNSVRSFVNYAIFRELCHRMRFEVDCAKSHHRVISEGLYCTSTTPDVMHLLCSLLMTVPKHNFIFTAQHVAGSDNKIPDALSHFNWQALRRLAPHADHHPTAILPHLWERLT